MPPPVHVSNLANNAKLGAQTKMSTKAVGTIKEEVILTQYQ